MDDRWINVICSLFIVFGILILFYFSRTYKPSYVSIGDITSELEGRKVFTSGVIYRTYTSKKNPDYLLIILKNKTSTISVPLFPNLVKEFRKNGIYFSDFKTGRFLEIVGTVDKYKGYLQVVPKKIEDVVLK